MVLLPATILHHLPHSQATTGNAVSLVSLIAPPESSNVAQDESVSNGTIARPSLPGIPWWSLLQRPLTDQSVSGSNGPFGGTISNGIGVIQQGVTQLGSTVQNGLNGVFGAAVSQANQGTVASLAPSMPLVSINFGIVPAFCPANCNMGK